LNPALRRLLAYTAIVVAAAGLCFAYYSFVWQAPPDRFTWRLGGEEYRLLAPRLLGLVLIAPLLVWALGWSLADLPWPQRVLSVLLRILFLALLAGAVAQPARTTHASRIASVFMVDVSDSVPNEALVEARKQVEAALDAKRDGDLVRLVTFAERPRLVELRKQAGSRVPDVAALRHALEPRTQPDAAGTKASPPMDEPKPGSESNLQAALQLAYGLYPPGYLKRAVLLSDGVETKGDLLAEASRAARFGVKLFTRAYRQRPPPEVAVRTLEVPSKVDIGQSFDVTAEVFASRPTTARARLYQGEVLNGLEGVRNLELDAGVNEVRFSSVVRVGGAVTYQLKLDQIESDEFSENNAYSATLDVPGRPTVLYVEGHPQRAHYFSSALSAQQFDVDVRTPSALPASLKELERFDFMVLSDVPRERVPVAAQELIQRYVRDMGGGFLFAGGESGYGLGGWAHTTIERLLPVRMDAERRKEMPNVAMVLVIDRSGSMTGLPIEMAKTACQATVGTLEGDDLIEVIAFDSTPERYVKMQPARYRSRIQNEILRIQPGGGTEIFASLDMAYQDISVVQARKKHVILLTDGNAPAQGIRDLVQAMLAEQVTVTTVGLGQTNGDLLRLIAETGGGRYHHVPDPNNLPRIFTRETELVSRQAAVEEWFPVQQTAPADFLRGIAIQSAPLLHGYVSTQMKAPPAQLILASDTGEPILARWRVGLGWALAWTSDVKNLWASDWLRWSGYSRFWGQLVREHMRSNRRQEIPMRTDVVGGRVHAVVDSFTPDERFDNALESKLVVTGPQPSGERREVAMRQTAPGRYEADFELDAYGSFLLRAEHVRSNPDGTRVRVAESFGQVSNPYPLEYAAFEPDIDRLRRAATLAGGALDPELSAVFDPGNEKIVTHEQAWSRLVLAAIVVFLLDLLVRRVRLFDRKFTARKRRAAA
jgi:Mg-chelatase subunit ChlD